MRTLFLTSTCFVSVLACAGTPLSAYDPARDGHAPPTGHPGAGGADAPAARSGEASPRSIPPDYPPPLGFSPSEAWLDRWPHSHFSRRGTPFVHLFNLEPAFLDRDLFLDYRVAAGDEEDETELEAELEWAITRRIGLVIEAPLASVNPEAGETEQGLGDVAVAPRFLLAETDVFLLAGNLEVSLPTGSESRGLGSGEFALAPSLSAWLDLGGGEGNWFTLSAQVGTERGLESADGEWFYNAALTYSFLGPRLSHGTHDHTGHFHFPPGLTSLIVEYTGRTGVGGADDGRSTGELLFGASYNLTEAWEARAAYQVPVGGERDIDYGYVLSLIYHF